MKKVCRQRILKFWWWFELTYSYVITSPIIGQGIPLNLIELDSVGIPTMLYEVPN